MTLLYLILLKAIKEEQWFWVLGLVSGLLAITESFYFPLLLIMPILIFLYQRNIKNVFKIYAILFLVCSPVMLHNYLYTDGAAVLSTKNSYNLWMDNNHFGITTHDQGEAGNHIPKDYFINKQRYQKIRPPCEVAIKDQRGCEAKNAIKFAINDPIRFAKRGFIKLVNYWSPNLFSFNIGFNKIALRMTRKMSHLLNNFFVLFQAFFLLLFFISFSLLLQIRSKLSTIALIHIVFTQAVVVWGHGIVRYRYGIVPILFGIIYYAYTQRDQVNFKSKSLWGTLILVLSFYSYIMISKLPIAITL